MFLWLFRRLLLKDMKKNLSIAEGFDSDTRRKMTRDFLNTRLILDREFPPDEKIERVSSLLKFWNSSRRQALELGATSANDANWNNAACIEVWVGIELQYLKGMVTLAKREAIRGMKCSGVAFFGCPIRNLAKIAPS